MNKQRTLRLRLCEEAEDALNILKEQTNETPTTIINTLLLNAVSGKEIHNEELQPTQE